MYTRCILVILYFKKHYKNVMNSKIKMYIIV